MRKIEDNGGVISGPISVPDSVVLAEIRGFLIQSHRNSLQHSSVPIRVASRKPFFATCRVALCNSDSHSLSAQFQNDLRIPAFGHSAFENFTMSGGNTSWSKVP